MIQKNIAVLITKQKEKINIIDKIQVKIINFFFYPFIKIQYVK